MVEMFCSTSMNLAECIFSSIPILLISMVNGLTITRLPCSSYLRASSPLCPIFARISYKGRCVEIYSTCSPCSRPALANCIHMEDLPDPFEPCSSMLVFLGNPPSIIGSIPGTPLGTLMMSISLDIIITCEFFVNYSFNVNATSLAKYVRIISAPARLIEIRDSIIAISSSHPLSTAPLTMEYSPLTL